MSQLPAVLENLRPTFADEPHFRLFWRGTLPLFMNAVLYSPSFPRE